jgi:hypothetical protein
MDKYDQFQVPYNLFSMVLVQWIPELRHYAPSVPIILVGTKLGMSHFQFSPWNMGSPLELNAVGSSSYQNFASQKLHFY